MKEQTLEGFKNKYGLSGLHSQPTGYMKFEDKTEEVFKDVELLIKETREETIREIEKKIVKYIDENKKKNFNNRELIGYEILDLIN